MTIITLTTAASDHIKKMLAQDVGKMGFRLSIKKTGCSGYAYVPALISEIKDDDIHFVTEDDLKVYIDPTCEEFVKNLVIDYCVDDTMGLKQKRLVFSENRVG